MAAERSPAVLLVEDEDVVRGLIRRILQAEGCTVLEARNGAEALAHLEAGPERPIDLLVTDLVMPSMSGSELAARLRERRPGTPVLWMSGYAESSVAHYGQMPEGTQFIQKPFAPTEFVRLVREALGAKLPPAAR